MKFNRTGQFALKAAQRSYAYHPASPDPNERPGGIMADRQIITGKRIIIEAFSNPDTTAPEIADTLVQDPSNNWGTCPSPR